HAEIMIDSGYYTEEGVESGQTERPAADHEHPGTGRRRAGPIGCCQEPAADGRSGGPRSGHAESATSGGRADAGPAPDRRGERAVMSGPAATRPKEGAMNDHILEMRSITKRYPGVVALQDVSLTVREGQIHAICGENGAGKSTLMKVLSGVEPSG